MKKLFKKDKMKAVLFALSIVVFQFSIIILVSLFSSVGKLLLALGLVCAIVISWNYICNVLTIKFK